ncbi:MAG TPA: AAA family ATPase, partial [Pirellulaceae bacterium]|nr:AAA family ATPase [Pirellulaceae bacterium]
MSQTKMLLPRDLTSVRIDRRPESSDDQNLIEVVRHVFDSASIAAVNGALAANRPLLVSGEPGVGKSQLAAAVAAELGRPFVSLTANSRTEVSDLLWRFDAVARLAEAQLCGAIAAGEP